MGAPIKRPVVINRRRVAIGRRIQHQRHAAGLTVTQAAAASSTSFWTWRRWEAGTHSVPAEMLPEVARALSCGVEDLCIEIVRRAVAA